ncbi:polysaccharide deacetylase family protein [Paenibacillus macerans]|uniref:polysaccharide deacetylase family protein n=1 Tax=Paenibacillus macerans TaxID=44252 RepID=UPI00203CA9EB|nr:polysaccharide deacetylase family protein [Paenibacillus macerans]MCM3701726.1 polysaccharide deacetylase family protein [Paenibacillus macerans]
MTLAEQLGYEPGAKLLIVNADDFGMCHAENVAIMQLLEEGAVSSATVMIPCGWAKEAAAWSAVHPEYDVGVHLTFTSEWSGYKWGPVTRNGDVSTLVTEEGYFPADTATFERQAARHHVRLEMVNQVETALALGLAPTHLDNHMGSLYGLATGHHFLDAVFEVCARYGLPFRMPRALPDIGKMPAEVAAMARQATELADRMGVVILDHLIGLPFGKQPGETYESYKRDMVRVLRSLRPGVSEIIIHPALASEELKAIHGEWEKRQWDLDLFRDPEVRETIRSEGIVMIRWRDLRKLQQHR